MRWLACAAIALAGCSGDDTDIAACAEDTVVTVAGTIFSWQPNCGVAGVTVLEISGPTVWYIQTSDDSNTVESGVTYGVAPDGTETIEPAHELQAGVQYQVILFIVRAVPGGTEVTSIAAETFSAPQ